MREVLLAFLDKAIGAQGYIHGDWKDDIIAFTLFVLLFRLPPGSDMGPFMWMRSAIYLRELDQYILFTAFKGRDLHTGYTPTVAKHMQDAFTQDIQNAIISMDEADSLFKQLGSQARVGYVLYPSMAATMHSTQILYTPSLHFLHSPAPHERDATRRYYSRDKTILGNAGDRAQRLGLEGFLALKNYFSECKINLSMNLNALLDSATYTDETGAIQKLRPAALDVEDDRTWNMMCLYRRFYFWLRELLSQYSLNITKKEFKHRQEWIRAARAGVIQMDTSLPTNRQLLPRPRRKAANTHDTQIERILKRQKHKADVSAAVQIYRLCANQFSRSCGQLFFEEALRRLM